MTIPLNGLRVLDFAHLLPGELATFWLGQLGAEIIKVERPGTSRLLGITPQHPYRSALNRGKKSIVLDLKRETNREIARGLLAWADVLVEGFRPGVMERLGLGWEDAHTLNPRLIYCRISGFGQTGPDRLRPGHDNTYLALSGLQSEITDIEGRPLLLPFQLADVGGGTFPALIGILAALWHRERTGKGTCVDVSMLEGTLSWAYMLLPSLEGGPGVKLWTQGLRGELPCYGLYETADGRHLALGALEPHFWAAFCRAVGREEWLGRGYDAALRPEIAALLREKPLHVWLGTEDSDGILNPHEIPVAPVRAIAEVAQDHTLREQGAITEDEHGRPHPALPIRFDGERPPSPRHIPAPGEDGEAIKSMLKRS